MRPQFHCFYKYIYVIAGNSKQINILAHTLKLSFLVIYAFENFLLCKCFIVCIFVCSDNLQWLISSMMGVVWWHYGLLFAPMQIQTSSNIGKHVQKCENTALVNNILISIDSFMNIRKLSSYARWFHIILKI